jgi:transcriptional regulator with XRE-family HTH domain
MANANLHPLRKWRISNGLTLQAAASLVGTSRHVWSDWERGRRRPDRTFMPRVRTATGLSADVFYPDLDGGASDQKVAA